MKIEEARLRYNTQIKSYHEQQVALSKQKKELEEKMKATENGKTIYANEAAILELTIQAVDEKQSEYQNYMDKLMQQKFAIENMVVAKQQGEAMEKEAEDLAKVMEVARRLMKGDIVPGSDEKKLMDYSMEMYQAAKNIGAMAKQREKEKHDSLGEEEEEPQNCEDPREVSNNTEAFAEGPTVVDVAETIASVEVGE